MNKSVKGFETEWIYGGIDLHKTFCVICLIRKDGRRIVSKRIPNHFDHYERFFKPFLEKFRIRVAIEAGNITFWLCNILHSFGIETYVVNTILNKEIANSNKKTDKRDARALSIQLSKEHLPERVYEPSFKECVLRSLIQHRKQLIKDRTRTSNRAYALLSRNGIFISKRSLRENERYWEVVLKDKLTERGSILNVEYKMYMSQFCLLNQQLNEIDTLIDQKAKELSLEDYYLIMSIPGIGRIIAAAIIAYCHDIIRFKNGRKLTSYIGIVPKIKESGDKKTYSGRITKMGVSILRAYLTQAALCLLRSRNEDVKEIKEWFNKIKVKKGWQKARIALARKLALIIFGVLKSRTKFDPKLIVKKVA